MKGTSDRRTSMGIRISASESIRWRHAAKQTGHKTLSSWLRAIADQEALTHGRGREWAEALAGLREELGRIGNNLNQLTRYSHQERQAQMLLDVLVEIQHLTGQVHEKLQSFQRGRISPHDHQ